jgi:hypothetical protein
MATYIPLFPEHMALNQAYLKIMDDHNLDRQKQWYLPYLQEEFGHLTVNDVLKLGYLIKQWDNQVTLGFLVTGTITNLILEQVENEPRSCKELLIKLPRHLKLASQDLKSQLAYLYNFNKIQVFVPPGSAITFIISDGPDHTKDHPVEKILDRLYFFSDRIEQKFAYLMPYDDTINELNQLV